MKKIILSLLALGTIAGVNAANPSAELLSTQTPVITPNHKFLQHFESLGNPVKANTRAASDWTFGYCAGLGSYIGMPAQYGGQYVLEEAIYIPEEFAKDWVNNKITSVSIGYGETSTMGVYVYITDSLDAEPSYMEEFTLQTPNAWNEVTLSRPYTITGKGFYLGYQTLAYAGEYPLGVDLISSNLKLGDIVGVFDNDGGGYDNLGLANGSNCIRFTMNGNVATDAEVIVDSMFGPQLIGQSDEDPFEFDVTMLNVGAPTLKNVELEFTIGGKPVTDLKTSYITTEGEDVPFGTLGLLVITGYVGDVTGNDLPVNLVITGLVDENDNVTPYYLEMEGSASVVAQTFKKNVVVEEFTGTWCGWCPRGIVGMEYMRKNYGGKGFIGIASHNGDPMAVPAYQEVNLAYSGGGYPSASFDRLYAPIQPGWETLEYYFDLMVGTPADAGVKVNAKYNEETQTITATATSTFGNDYNNADFALCFVVTQDHVGPYGQTNYYAGGNSGEAGMEEWEKKGAKPSTYFDEVARAVEGPFGIDGSIPSTIKAYQDYEYTVTFDTSDIDEFDYNESYVVAFIINNKNKGVIVNGDEVALGTPQAGVESIVAAQDGVYRVFNLQGVKVLETTDASAISNLGKGIYIINGKKVIL